MEKLIMKIIKSMFFLLIAVCFASCKTMPQEQSLHAFSQRKSEELMNKFEPRDGVMSILADAVTGEILACSDLPETDVDRTETYFYDPGRLFNVFRDCALMFLPEDLRDSEKAMQYVLSQFGFTQTPLVTARQVVEAARVFANHGMRGDVAVVSPNAADAMLHIMAEASELEDVAMVKYKDESAVSTLAFGPAKDPQYILYIVVLHPTK